MKDLPEDLPGNEDPPEARLPISPMDGLPTSSQWFFCSREFDELLIRWRFPKTLREVMLHIGRRESEDRGCDEGCKGIAHWTRTHKDHVKRVIRRLVRAGLVTRLRRPGDTSVLRISDKIEWLRKNPPGATIGPPPGPEELDADLPGLRRRELWDRVLAFAPLAPFAPFKRMMDKNIDLFEKVLDEVEDRIKRGADPRRGAERLSPVGNPVGLFVDLFGRWLKANER